MSGNSHRFPKFRSTQLTCFGSPLTLLNNFLLIYIYLYVKVRSTRSEFMSEIFIFLCEKSAVNDILDDWQYASYFVN